MSKEQSQLTVSISTCNRPNDLIECLKSIGLLKNLKFDIIVVDDASDQLIANHIASNIDADLARKIKVIRYEENKNYIVARNQMAREAQSPYILSLDDDAMLFDAESIYQAVEILEQDPQVGAVALSELNKDGGMHPSFMQPAPITYNCYVPSFIGYGHILRRDLFLKLGGYREIFQSLGEESEYCKRMLDNGFGVVYIPSAKVIHNFSPTSRIKINAFRNSIRNRCFDAIYNEPLPIMLLTLTANMLTYFRSYELAYRDASLPVLEGKYWLIEQLISNLSLLWSERKSLKLSTYYLWYNLRKDWPAYIPKELS